MDKFKEELVRMIKSGHDIYFHQADICRILERIKKESVTLESKARITQAIEVFSCIVDPLVEDDE